VQLSSTCLDVLAGYAVGAPLYMVHIVREAIEIELCLYNMKREGGSCLSKSWKTLIYSLKTFRTPAPLGYVVPTLSIALALSLL
jgi:hypothetical protein